MEKNSDMDKKALQNPLLFKVPPLPISRTAKEFIRRAIHPRKNRRKSPSCSRCSCLLGELNWSESNRLYGRYICRPCWNARQKKYDEKLTPEQWVARKARANKRRREWPESRKITERRKAYNNWLKRKYGITIETYDRMYVEQGGECLICSRKSPKGKGGFHVDHCHKSGAVRGLLCTSCNMMIGMAAESIETLNKAIIYLSTHAARLLAGGKQF